MAELVMFIGVCGFYTLAAFIDWATDKIAQKLRR